MPDLIRQAESLEETRAFARELGAMLRPGDVVLLDGPLGAGKTTLVRAMAGELGLDESMVSSPTFVVVNEYPGNGGPDLVHADAYRLSGSDDLDALGWDRLTSGGAIVLVEWGERIEDACPDAARLKIEPTGASSRRFTLTLPGSWADRGGSVNPGEPERRATTCPVTGQRVAPDCPTWPFASERARMADLHKWFSGQHTISRPLEQADLEQGE